MRCTKFALSLLWVPWHEAGSVLWDAARGDIASVKCKTNFFLCFSFNAASWGGRDEGDRHLNWENTAAGRQHAHGHTQSCRQTGACTEPKEKKKKTKEKRKKKRQ